MTYPVVGKCYVTQEYGLTNFAQSPEGKAAYKNFPGGMHPGYDFGTGGINAPVQALVAGKIVYAGANGGWGNYVELEGADGWRRQYAHLSSIAVTVGQTVITGDVLGRVGTTGASTGIHLHYGNRRRKLMGWEYRDPSADWTTVPPVATMPTKKLIKAKDNLAVYIYNGKQKFLLPDWPTKIFLFGDTTSDIEEVESDIISKIPMGSAISSLA